MLDEGCDISVASFSPMCVHTHTHTVLHLVLHHTCKLRHMLTIGEVKCKGVVENRSHTDTQAFSLLHLALSCCLTRSYEKGLFDLLKGVGILDDTPMFRVCSSKHPGLVSEEDELCDNLIPQLLTHTRPV